MKFMMLIKHPGDYDIKDVPPALFPAMDEFIKTIADKGAFIDGAGLKPLKNATRVRLSGGKVNVIDGPFSEAKEVVGGYSIIEAKSQADAVEIARRFMELHRIHWPGFEGESEVRPFEDMG
jgi:hypothetical protein